MDVPIEIWMTIYWVAGGAVLALVACLAAPFLGHLLGDQIARIFGL